MVIYSCLLSGPSCSSIRQSDFGVHGGCSECPMEMEHVIYNVVQKSCWWGVIPSWPLLWSPPWLFRSTSQWCTPATLSAATIFWMLFRLIWGFLWRFFSQALLQFSPWLTSPEISPFNFPLTYSEISPESYCLTPTWNFLLTRPEIFLLTCFLSCPVGCESSLLVLMMEMCSIGLEQIQRCIQIVAHVLK